MKKLTPWQRLARIAYKYKMRTHGYDAPEIAETIIHNRKVSDEDKQQVKEIMDEWAKVGNRRNS